MEAHSFLSNQPKDIIELILTRLNLNDALILSKIYPRVQNIINDENSAVWKTYEYRFHRQLHPGLLLKNKRAYAHLYEMLPLQYRFLDSRVTVYTGIYYYILAIMELYENKEITDDDIIDNNLNWDDIHNTAWFILRKNIDNKNEVVDLGLYYQRYKPTTDIINFLKMVENDEIALSIYFHPNALDTSNSLGIAAVKKDNINVLKDYLRYAKFYVDIPGVMYLVSLYGDKIPGRELKIALLKSYL